MEVGLFSLLPYIAYYKYSSNTTCLGDQSTSLNVRIEALESKSAKQVITLTTNSAAVDSSNLFSTFAYDDFLLVTGWITLKSNLTQGTALFYLPNGYVAYINAHVPACTISVYGSYIPLGYIANGNNCVELQTPQYTANVIYQFSAMIFVKK